MARGTHSSTRSARRKASRPTRHDRRQQRSGRRPRIPRLGNGPGERLIAIGVALFALGLIAIAVTFVPFITLRRSNTDLAVNLGTFATVLGLALGVLGAYRQARSLNS